MNEIDSIKKQSYILVILGIVIFIGFLIYSIIKIQELLITILPIIAI